MKYNINKKAVSEVLANISLVLITIALIGVVAPLMIGLVKNNLDDAGACVGMEDTITFDGSFGYNCIENNGARQAKITLRITGENESYSKIQRINILFTGNGTAKSYIIPSSNITMLASSEIESQIPPIGSARTYIINVSEIYEKAEVSPMLENDKVCTTTDEVVLAIC